MSFADADEACQELLGHSIDDVEPLELKYLRTICRYLNRVPDLDAFDADELGEDPEED